MLKKSFFLWNNFITIYKNHTYIYKIKDNLFKKSLTKNKNLTLKNTIINPKLYSKHFVYHQFSEAMRLELILDSV